MEHHLRFWEAGFPVFPLHSFSDGRCGCGDTRCLALGKHPRSRAWQHTPIWDDEQMETMQEVGHWDSGYGVLCKGLLVVDVDVRNGGEASYAKLIEAIPEIAGAGLIVKSGRGDGGRHLYFSIEAPPAMMTHHADYPGLDFKSSGYVVGPGSKHAAGGVYTIGYGSVDDIEPAPAALIDLLRKPDRHRAEYDGRSIDVSQGDIADMLSYVDPDCAYDTWIRIGMSIHHATGGTGLGVWDEWSGKGSKYDADCMEGHWHSFGRSANPATLGTLIYHAQAGGWIEPVTFGDEPRADDPPDEDDGPTDDGLPFDISTVSLTHPPGFVGEVAAWIDGNCRSPRKHIATGAALFSLGAAFSLHYTASSRVSPHMLAFCIAGSRTGKESIESGAGEVIRAAGLGDAIAGKFKSEQEIIRNLLRNQCAFHLVDEMGLELSKLQNAQKRGGTPYLEGIIGTLMSVYGKSDSVMPLTGDAKHEAQQELRKRLSGLQRKRDENEGGPRIEAEIEQVEQAIRRTRDGLPKPILGVLGFSTPVTFDSLLDYTSGTNGFIGRSLIFVEHETVPELRDDWTYTPMPDGMRNTILMLSQAGYSRDDGDRIEFYGDKVVVPTDDRAADMLRGAAQWLRHKARGEKSTSGLESLWLGSYELVEKVSLILAIAGGVRMAEHVRWAFALIKRDVEQKIRSIVSNDREKDSPLMALQAKIINLCSGDGGETIGVIVNRCRGKRKEDVERALEGLVTKGRVRVETAGRHGRSSRYFSVDAETSAK